METAAGHLAMVSHPAQVVALIKEAAETARRSSTESAAAVPHARQRKRAAQEFKVARLR